jgi:hypothetical protein
MSIEQIACAAFMLLSFRLWDAKFVKAVSVRHIYLSLRHRELRDVFEAI